MLTNGVLALILIVVGCVCFFPAAANVSSQLEERVIRRGTSADGVSLMINVYWGTEEVDGILDVLEEYGAKATFFLGGSWADDNTACVRRIAAAGHEIGTHGYFHRDHTTLGYDGNIKEIADSVQFLSLVTGEAVTLFAPPSAPMTRTPYPPPRLWDLKPFFGRRTPSTGGIRTPIPASFARRRTSRQGTSFSCIPWRIRSRRFRVFLRRMKSRDFAPSP